MLKRFWKFLYGDVPVRFPSEFSLAESVTRLRARTRRSVFSSLLRQAAVGRVTESDVRLERFIPLFHNGPGPKAFMTFCLAFMLIWTIGAAFATLKPLVDDTGRLTEEPMLFLLPIFGVASLVLGIGFVRFGWWLSRNDMRYLASVIERALQKERLPPAIEPTR